VPTPSDASQRVLSSEYEHYCQTLLETEDGEGWSSELRQYLKDRPADVTKGTCSVCHARFPDVGVVSGDQSGSGEETLSRGIFEREGTRVTLQWVTIEEHQVGTWRSHYYDYLYMPSKVTLTQ
jgi:hypothetical protein